MSSAPTHRKRPSTRHSVLAGRSRAARRRRCFGTSNARPIGPGVSPCPGNSSPTAWRAAQLLLRETFQDAEHMIAFQVEVLLQYLRLFFHISQPNERASGLGVLERKVRITGMRSHSGADHGPAALVTLYQPGWCRRRLSRELPYNGIALV